MEKNEVNTAFEILLEEIEAVADGLNETGAEAFRAGDYEKAKAAIEEAARLAEFREKVKALQKEWAGLLPSQSPARKHKGRKSKARLARGLRTSEDAFRRPILEALAELGGGAPIGDALKVVEKKMKRVLNENVLTGLLPDRRLLPAPEG